jgi:Spy/CpxP family protein refolding chaperone
MHFIGPVFLGIFIALFARRALRWHHFHHGFHGGCGRMGSGPWGFRGPFGWRGGGPRQIFWFVRELELSPAQVTELKDAWLKGRGAVASVRASGLEAAHAVFDAALAEPFDRARVDDAARRHTDHHAQAARDLSDAISRAVDVLTPEQRQKVRERFARYGTGGWATGPGVGPYR